MTVRWTALLFRLPERQGDYTMAIKNMVRIPPVPADDLEGMAGWLESMALQGLYFDGLFYSRYFLTTFLFKEGPPAQVRYRIDPAKGTLYSDPPAGLVELYEESGWTYMGSTGRYSHIFMTKDSDLPEPYDQPEILGQALSPQVENRKRGLFLAGMLLIMDVFLFCSILHSALILRRPVWYQAVPIILLVLAITLSAQHLRMLSEQKQQFELGRPFTPHIPAHNKLRICALIILTILYSLLDLWLILR